MLGSNDGINSQFPKLLLSKQTESSPILQVFFTRIHVYEFANKPAWINQLSQLYLVNFVLAAHYSCLDDF